MDYVIQLIKMVVILSIFSYGAFLITKKIKQKQLKRTSENNFIQIVDGVQVAMGQGVYLIKVAEEYFVMSSGNNGVAMTKLEQKILNDPKEKWDEAFGETNPNVALKSILKATKDRLVKK